MFAIRNSIGLCSVYCIVIDILNIFYNLFICMLTNVFITYIIGMFKI